jgi:hypothetical protein
MSNLRLWAVLAVVTGLAAIGVAACSDSEANVAGHTDGGPLPPPGNEPFDAAPAEDAGETPDTGSDTGTRDATPPADAGSDAPTDAPVG